MVNFRGNVGQPVDPLLSLNDPGEVFKNDLQLTFMRVLVDAVRQILANMVNKNTATSHFILRSPGGVSYKVTVNDAGVITTVNARG